MRFLRLYFFLLIPFLLIAQKVEITSDTMKAIEKQKEIHFIGDVTIKQQKSWIHGDKVIVLFDENNETKQYEAIGKVTFEFRENNRFYKGKAHKVTYMPVRSVYILRGNAVVDDMINKRHIDGDFITLDLTSGLADVQGAKKKPVKFVFEPEEKKKKQ
jgi:lipopolysaccharide export system protein LptA